MCVGHSTAAPFVHRTISRRSACPLQGLRLIVHEGKIGQQERQRANATEQYATVPASKPGCGTHTMLHACVKNVKTGSLGGVVRLP
eukprot:27916-Amphidinium_carterae.2